MIGHRLDSPCQDSINGIRTVYTNLGFIDTNTERKKLFLNFITTVTTGTYNDQNNLIATNSTIRGIIKNYVNFSDNL